MSWHYLQGQEAASWEENSLAGAPSALLRLLPGQGNPCLIASETESLSRSRSGTMCKPSPAGRGAELSMSSRADSRAKTSALQAPEKESPVQGLGFGGTWPASLVRFDRDSRSWKTRQLSLLEGLDVFSETWPKWGIMRGGECWALKMPSGILATRQLITNALASGLLQRAPTPTVCGNYNRKGASKHSGEGLATWVKRLPTPTAQDAKNSTFPPSQKDRDSIIGYIIRYATPTASTGGPEPEGKTGRKLVTQIGGALNPAWVEWLMGWPVGWTDSAPLEMDKFQQWLRLHGSLLQRARP